MGLGDEACTDFDATTNSYKLFIRKGVIVIDLSRSVAAQDASVPGKLQQAATMVLSALH